jgi:hypothetical protein
VHLTFLKLQRLHEYSLRTLMIVVLVVAPLLAGGWLGYRRLFPPTMPRETSTEELRRIWELNASPDP